MKKNIGKKEYLLKMIEQFEKYNSYSPFPIYDTADLKKFKEEINKMSDYNDDPVECCGGCKHLFLVEDDFGNTWCGKCNSLNSIEEIKNIETYKKLYGHIWNYF